MPDSTLKILVVDDMATARKIIKNILGQLGYWNVEEAGDGRQALDRLRHQSFDLVISDWGMPKMTGVDLVQSMRQDPGLRATPFLMVTPEAEQAKVLEAIKAGVNGYIVSPVTIETLKEKINALFESRL
jgi:two-component system chemotaxis response regulator CheY